MTIEILPWNPKWLTERGNHVTLITPDLARELLEKNTNNRRPKVAKIQQYARDMRAGKWDPDASDIKISMDGELLDGQNRLYACIESNTSFATLVRFGLKQATKTHVDTGAKRTASEALKMAGVGGYHAAIAAAINYRFRIQERLDFFHAKRAMDSKPLVALTHEEMLAFLANHPMLEKFAPQADKLRTMMPALPVSSILAFLSLAAEVDEPTAQEFVHNLTHGQYGGPGDPMQALVEYAARTRALKSVGSGGIGRVAQEEHFMALVKVWKAIRNGEKIQRLSIRYNDLVELPA